MDEAEWPPPAARVQSAIWLEHARRRLGRREARLVKLVERVLDS